MREGVVFEGDCGVVIGNLRQPVEPVPTVRRPGHPLGTGSWTNALAHKPVGRVVLVEHLGAGGAACRNALGISIVTVFNDVAPRVLDTNETAVVIIFEAGGVAVRVD